MSLSELSLFTQRVEAELQREFQGKPFCLGELSSSALSTAVSCIALRKIDVTQYKQEIEKAQGWMLNHQNEDGGWGDTVESPSNISTSLLVWAAISDRERDLPLEGYLKQELGSLNPESIVEKLKSIYGKDKTFAVPICMALAVSGRLGEQPHCWKYVDSLPFELAAAPREWYQYLKLSVVSYAIPALISIGIVKHSYANRWNPWFWVRRLCRSSCLKVLARVQPENGGFLEAVPLTAFSAMALCQAGLEDLEVVKKAESFLVESIRHDGSSPIDTNLSLWLTSLSLQAFSVMGHDENEHIANWIAAQQRKKVDAYSGAAPGSWAWTPLPGGVPDADDTSAALLALMMSGYADPKVLSKGIQWLVDLQNSDGGIPTFCRGWGQLPFDQSCSDITAHALRAFELYKDSFSNEGVRGLEGAIERAYAFLMRTQKIDGSWVPLWFGSQALKSKENPVYGTSKVLLSLVGQSSSELSEAKVKGVAYLKEVQQIDGGFAGAAQGEASIEETALALKSLLEIEGPSEVTERAIRWLWKKTEEGTTFPTAPIGLYFASLWYSEKLYPIIFSLDALKSYEESLGSKK